MTQTEPLVNGYDLGDLLSDIDRQIGHSVERAAQRYLPFDKAQSTRRAVVKLIGDQVIEYDGTITRDHSNDRPWLNER